jgi:hypothetical protein
MRVERRRGYVLLVGGPVPRGSDAITLGRFVSVRHAAARSPYLLRHELVHVSQWRRHGVVGFLARYCSSYVGGRLRRKGHSGAYLHIPLEIEADWIARRPVHEPTRLT